LKYYFGIWFSVLQYVPNNKLSMVYFFTKQMLYDAKAEHMWRKHIDNIIYNKPFCPLLSLIVCNVIVLIVNN